MFVTVESPEKIVGSNQCEFFQNLFFEKHLLKILVGTNLILRFLEANSMFTFFLGL